MGEDTETSKLLRLKRYEQPPPGYFDDFLREFHRRQRLEFMRQSRWEILWDRFTSLAPSFRVPQFAYGAIAALALCAAFFIVAPKPSSTSGALARTDTSAPTLSLTPQPVTIGDALPVSASADGSLPPHYVLQSRPVSNEQPLSF